MLIEGNGLPIGTVLAGANRHDSPLLEPSLQCLPRFGFCLPDQITVHLDAGYNSSVIRQTLTILDCDWQISPKGTFVQINHTKRWMIERTNSWHTRVFGILQVVLDRSAPTQQAWTSLANAIIVLRRLLKEAWVKHRWDTRPVKSYDFR